MRTCVLAAVISLASTSLCSAQTASTPELVTDRPDFTESSDVVGRGVIQVETGLRFEQSDETTRQVSTPLVLVRIGLAARVELRFEADGFVSQLVQTPMGEVRSSGASDLEIGAKVRVLDAATAGVDVAVIPFVSVPTASTGFGSTGYDPGVKLTWSRDLPKGFGVSGNFNARWGTGEAGARGWDRELSVSVGHGLGGPWTAYWEAYGLVDGSHCDCTVNTGLSRALGANSQIDVEVGRGISGDAQDWFLGVGFSVRRLRH